MDPSFLIAFVAFVVVFGAVAAYAVFFAGNEDSKAVERLDLLVGRRSTKDSSADLLLKQALQEVDQKNLLDAITPDFLQFDKYFEQADVTVKPSALFGTSILFAVVGGLLSVVATRILFVAPVGALVAFTVPWIWLYMKRSSRLAAFAAQLPDALELVARALRAGHSLAAGMHVVAEEMPQPISKEFGRVYEEQNLGIPLEEAMRTMANRVPNLDLRFFVTAVAIQRQTGGDLAEILDKIGHVVRERYKILGHIKALTGEGRLSGVVLIGLPFLLFIFMLHSRYEYIKLLWTDPFGIKMSVAALVMQVVGAYVIKKIVDIKV